MKILLIHGFLGAGKTTFIKKMVEMTGKQFVIVENEYGEANIDSEILSNDFSPPEDVEMKVWELTEGCICCSLNLDFSYSVLTIANTLDPDYLIVEPSGVAFPGKIIDQLNRISYERIELLAPINIIDAQHVDRSKVEFPQYFENQLHTAGTVVLSKSENFSTEDFEALRKDLSIPKAADFPTSHYSTWTQEEWLLLLHKKATFQTQENETTLQEVEVEAIETPELENLALYEVCFKHPYDLIFALEALIHNAAGYVVRAKGYFPIGSVWYRFDLVEGTYMITECSPKDQTKIVVIGQKLNRSLIQELFETSVVKNLSQKNKVRQES